MEGWRVAHTERSFSLAPCASYFSVRLGLFNAEFPSPFFHVGSGERWEFRQSWLAIYAAHTSRERNEGRSFDSLASLSCPPPYNKRPHTHVGYPQSPHSASHPVIQLSFLWMAGWQSRRSRKSERARVRDIRRWRPVTSNYSRLEFDCCNLCDVKGTAAIPNWSRCGWHRAATSRWTLGGNRRID
jgi:hypothetical protein